MGRLVRLRQLIGPFGRDEALPGPDVEDTANAALMERLRAQTDDADGVGRDPPAE
jgi:hypothetical protein